MADSLSLPAHLTTYSTEARWLWLDGDPSPPNAWADFRRRFSVPAGALAAAYLLVTADSRYHLTINNQFVGRGPVRSFPFAYGYDVYEVGPLLREGHDNVVAATVTHWGDGTMQYLRGRGGFLCELVLVGPDGTVRRITGGRGWRARRNSALASHAPRISIQLPFEEQYDARQEVAGWSEPGFDDRGWEDPVEVGPPGCPPWTGLAPRSIPFLCEDLVAPTRVLAVELARPREGTWWALDVRHLAGTSVELHNSAPLGEMGHALVTEVVVAQPCQATLWATWNYEPGAVWLRGQPVSPPGGIIPLGAMEVTLDLEAGPNLLVVAQCQRPALHLSCDQPVTFSARRLLPPESPEAPWAYLGPLDERTDSARRLRASRVAEDLPQDVRRVPVDRHEAMLDVFAVTSSQRFYAVDGGFCAPEIAGPTPRPLADLPRAQPVATPDALLHDNGDWTEIAPQPDGDAHLVVDFGRELVGYLELELDAPEGAIVDANLFEGIDETGIFWTWGLHNSLRYTCRDGHQTFRSFIRRGFRYASLTVRNHRRPLRVRRVACLLNTYPVQERGQFACSDALLTEIWRVAAYTVRLCMEDTYVDCPAYEQVFWVGDARNSALVNAVAFGAYALTDRCLRLVGQSLSRDLDPLKRPELRARPHLTTDHVVSSWFSEIPMWTFLWVWNVWEHYWLTGDRAALADHYEPVRRCLEIAEGFLTERDLLDVPDVWNLVDWAAMDLTRSGEVTSNTALMAEALRRAALMADTLDRPDEGARYRALAHRLREAINRHCWDEQRGAYVDTVRDATAYTRAAALAQQVGYPPEEAARFAARERISEPTNTLVLLCDCATPERRERVAPLALAAREGHYISSSPWASESWPAEQVVPVGSPWFLFFTLETLIALGHTEMALEIVGTQWARMLEKGATTFWETFPGGVGAGHWSRSLCHGWSAAPAYFLSTQVLGITPAAAGYAHVAVAPHPPAGLTWARGVTPTPRGDVTVSWSRSGAGPSARWTVALTLPPTSTGEVTLPGGSPNAAPTIAGSADVVARWTGDGWRLDLPAGASVTVS